MITYADKSVGDQFTAGNANEIKNEVNKLFTRGEAILNEPLAVTIDEQNEWVIIGEGATAGILVGFTFENGVFTFTETANSSMLVCSFVCEAPNNNQDYQFGIFKNDEHLYNLPVNFKFADTTQTVALNKLLDLTENDTIDIRVRNVNNTNNILISTMSTTIN